MTSMRRHIACFSAAGAVVATLSCGGDSVAPPPPPEGVQAVTVSPARDTLVFLNDTVHLSATGRDHAGTVLPNAAFTWTSSDDAVATVGTTGIVTGKKNGTAIITATSNEKSAAASIVVRQRAATLEILQGLEQGATVGFPLDTALGFLVKDAGGSLAEGVVLSFTPAAGAGSANPAQASTSATGEVTTSWTLGTAPGLQQITVAAVEVPTISATIEATAFAGEPDTMFVVGGTSQSEWPSTPLPEPLQVKVVDVHGNAIADAPIVFSVTSGTGTLDATEVFTDLEGVASVRWTLGPEMGAQSAQAILPDSAVGAIVDLPGSPVTFTATAVGFALTGVAATPVVGQEMILQGTGFDPVPANNAVTVGGLSATVTAVTESQTKLHVMVPSFGCVPAQPRDIIVTRNATTVQTSSLVHPGNALALAVGEHRVITDPASYCLQFLASLDGDYVVGVTSTRALNAELHFRMFGDAAGAAPAGLRSLGTRASIRGTQESLVTTPDSRERALRDWESDFFRSTKASRAAAALRASPQRRLNAVGDMIDIRVPDITTDACNNFTTVTARVIAMGPRVTIATNATLPADPASVAAVTAAVDNFVNQFGAAIYSVITTHFGIPADIDGNERVTVLFSPAVTGLPVFTSAVDHVSSSLCPASNDGEVVYATIGGAPASTDIVALLTSSLPGLTHELTHLIQLSRRISAGGFPLPYWLAEGQAMLGAELAGLTVQGDAGRLDYGASIVNADAASALWYDPLFDNLSYLFGWTGDVGSIGIQNVGRCSVFGFAGITTPCVGNYARGASWSFLRFVADRMATAYTTGEAGFLRDLIGTTPDADAVAVLESLVDAKLDELLVQWAMALFVDGRVPAASAPMLQLPSWNFADIFDARPAAERLNPLPLEFVDFLDDGSVVGGGTFYTRINNGGPHAHLAVKVADPQGNSLGEELRPRLWVVRLK